ncbi:MAG: hypothetical protein WBU92_10540 [Candidatus Dormiibacterota bacterium]
MTAADLGRDRDGGGAGRRHHLGALALAGATFLVPPGPRGKALSRAVGAALSEAQATPARRVGTAS